MVVGNRFFAAFTLITVALALDPTPSERAKWDAVCMEKAGQQFRMTFDANGKPTGLCEAPPQWKCYWGPFKDAKTGADGCCGKDKGTYSTDSRFPQEGACCVSPNVYSFDNLSNRGGCCPSSQGWTFDANAGKGGCCALDRRWMLDTTTNVEACCPAGTKVFTNPKTNAAVCCMVPDVLSVEVSGTKAGCCRTGLQYMSDAASGLERCCSPTQTLSVDRASNKAECCDAGKVFIVDGATGKGGCCAPGQAYSVDATSGQGGCCAPGGSFKVDPTTGSGGCCAATHDFSCDCSCKAPPPATCPSGHGTTFTASNGKRFKLYCNLINHGDNDLGFASAPDWATCINRCAGTSNCVRAIYEPVSKTCYLRTHGNQPVPVTPDPYYSAHLIEDPVVPPVTTIPKECPDAEGKHVTIGGIEYQLFCTKSFSNAIEASDSTDASDIEDCMKDCSANPDCHGVNFFDDGQPGGCVHASEWEFEPTGSQLTGKAVVAIPVKKRS